MSMSVGVDIGVPGVIMSPSEELALAAKASERPPMIEGLCRVHKICRGLDGRRMGRGATRRDALSKDRSIVDCASYVDGPMDAKQRGLLPKQRLKTDD